ncbi:MAG: cytochrome C, partial [Gammaproteobacteria bacterium]|nr:cytochrome C [Gammaproteobacteria bacterium]
TAPDEGGVWRSMDCVDCHNRPSHIYQSPGPAIDLAIEAGLIDRSLPFIKRESLRVIKTQYESHEIARDGITRELNAFYATNYPDLATERADDIAAAAEALGEVFSVNVFPQMNVWWDTYPNHIGHEQSDGCFRCHRRSMRTEDRKQVSNDCENCHILLAEEEENPDIMSILRPE